MRITIELDSDVDADRIRTVLAALNEEHEARQDAELAEIREELARNAASGLAGARAKLVQELNRTNTP